MCKTHNVPKHLSVTVNQRGKKINIEQTHCKIDSNLRKKAHSHCYKAPSRVFIYLYIFIYYIYLFYATFYEPLCIFRMLFQVDQQFINLKLEHN